MMNVTEATLAQVMLLEGGGGEELSLSRVAGLQMSWVHGIATGKLAQPTVAGQRTVNFA